MSSKRVPKSVYYRGHDVPVIQQEASYMENCLGQFCHERMDIWLLEGMKPSVEESTFIHEVIELINLVDYLEMEHSLITQLANALFQFLKENDIHLYYKQER